MALNEIKWRLLGVITSPYNEYFLMGKWCLSNMCYYQFDSQFESLSLTKPPYLDLLICSQILLGSIGTSHYIGWFLRLTCRLLTLLLRRLHNLTPTCLSCHSFCHSVWTSSVCTQDLARNEEPWFEGLKYIKNYSLDNLRKLFTDPHLPSDRAHRPLFLESL